MEVQMLHIVVNKHFLDDSLKSNLAVLEIWPHT